METSAAGQLGGYDTTDEVRKSLAAESPAFKCSMCNKSNREIIKECEERAKAEGPSEEVQVPEELNMGFKDEMEAKKKAGESKDEEEEGAQLAEGFVQTAPLPPANANSGAAASTATPIQAAQATVHQRAPRPAQTVPQPTATIPPPAHQAQAQAAGPRRLEDGGVPVWIDRLIVALVALLAFLILRVMFDL